MNLDISFIDRKTNVLTPSSLHCFRNGVVTINPTQGCSHQCAYCYARGYRIYPGDQKVVIYQNLLNKLRKELPRKRVLPKAVFFSTSCDAFQPVPQVLEVTYRIMELLLSHGIGVSFLTKGTIPRNFMALFEENSSLVNEKIGLITVNRRFQQVLEPYAATPEKRLRNIEGLIDRGVYTEVRMDPVIPGLTDGEEILDDYFKTISECNVKSVIVNYLLLRNMIKRNLKKAFGLNGAYNRIFDLYEAGMTVELKAENSRAFALSPEYRRGKYDEIASIASRYNIKTHICGCKNSDVISNAICSRMVDGS